MTRDADFKKVVRARMSATGETYLQARTKLLSSPAGDGSDESAGRVLSSSEAAPFGSDPASQVRAGVQHFFDGRRLRSVPAKRAKRMAVLLTLMTLFEPGRAYSEAEVRELLGAVHEDHAFLRRELVNVGYVLREGGIYTVAAAPPERDARWAHEFPSQERDVFAALWARSA